MQQAYVDTDSGQGIIYIIVYMITITITITMARSRITDHARMVEEPEPSCRFAGTPRYTQRL